MSKYKAKPIVIDGIRFASGKEGAKYSELRILERAGHITNLELQPVFKFSVAGNPVKYPSGRQAKYIADFAFFDQKQNRRIVLDVKGVKTEVYKLKKAFTEALNPGMKIEEAYP